MSLTPAVYAVNEPRPCWPTAGRVRRRVRIALFATGIFGIGGGFGLWLLQTGADAVLTTVPLQTSPPTGRVVVDERAGRVIVVGAGRAGVGMSVIATDTGLLVHTTALRGGSLGLAAVASSVGHIFVLGWTGAIAGSGDTMYTLDTRTGALLGTTAIPFNPLAIGVDNRGGHIFVASAGGMKAGSTTFLGPGTVSMLDARSGTVLRRIRVGVRPNAIAVDGATRRVFIVNGGQLGRTGLGPGSVSVLDAETGRTLKTVGVGKGAVAATVDEKTGRVFVANEESRSITTLDARSGTIVRTVPVGFATVLAVDERTGRIIVADGGAGTVSVLDATTGTIVRTVFVGGGPTAVAVDARTHRAFVTSTGGASRFVPHRLPRVLSGLVSLFVDPHAQTYVSVLDTQSGALLHDVHIGSGVPREIAVDQQTGHAFVTTPDSNSVSMLDATR